MFKALLLTLTVPCCFCQLLIAQTNHITDNGNIGIGITSPRTMLELSGNSVERNASPFITLNNRGANTTYGTIHVLGGILGSAYRDIRDPAYVTGMWFERLPAVSGLSSGGDIVFGATTEPLLLSEALPAERMRITSIGNVLIGKSTQNNTKYKLDVDGVVRANRLVVNATGADFVFDPAYPLLSLQALDKYVQTNRHLPEIAPAAQMQQEGLDVGDHQIKLLQKIEELTLYLIEVNKTLEKQQTTINQLTNQLEALQQKK
ncbi:hypothetical protein ACDQ55_14035 [Chitinophaga sp. 30R24]|uniref:hypothetical protein n=1 Tax=Chitinophaga sp. 30R24 TaxID=3248838 RepID=UPI003B90F960